MKVNIIRTQTFLWLLCYGVAPLPTVFAQWPQTMAAPATECAQRSPRDTLPAPLVDTNAPKRWSRADLDAIARHELCIGMTMDMLRKSWGFPGRIQATISPATSDTTVQFYYYGNTVVLVNNTVRAIRPPDPKKAR